jgi:hypothetical protein
MIYFGGLVGLLLPFRIIYTDDLLDTKIKKPFGYRGKTIIPFIGDVPTSDFPLKLLNQSKTSSAEALRLIRTNLEFMLTKVSDGIAKTIFVTSTFLTKERLLFRQILRRLSHCQVKVLLIGMDFRNPRLNEYMVVQEQGSY